MQKNKLTFLNIKNKENISINLNSYIRLLQLSSVYRINIDHNLINRFVFYNTSLITIDGVFTYIYLVLFKTLVNLSYLQIGVNNIKELLHSSDNKWMHYLFYQGITYENKYEMEISNNSFNNSFIFTLLDYSNSYCT